MSDPFAAYSLPVAIVEGTKIPLPGTAAVFTVKLPSALDEDFQTRVMASLSTETEIDPETGEIRSRVDAISLQAARRKTFFGTCVLSAEGLPDDMSPGDFFAKYQLAARTIFETASDMATQADTDITEALEKLKPTPNGKTSGPEK